MTMAHRTETGAAVISNGAAPRPDPGDADALGEAFDPNIRSVSEGRRAALARGFWWVFAGLVLALWLLWTVLGRADAQDLVPLPAGHQACAPHAEIVIGLERKYAEHQRGIGLDLTGRMVELFMAKDGVTWTVVVTTPGGMACIVAAGESFELLPEPRPEDPKA